MPKEQQTAFMKQRVIPNMTAVFKEHDATRYANFTCTTCHGPQYKDPHDFLPRLKVKNGMPTAFTEKPEVAQFMASSVVPKMASAMGLAPFDMKTKQGFGCAGCHAMDME